jgi:adenosylcobinamide-phosphate synthase
VLISLPTAAAAGIVADRVVGEPPDRWHPVAAFGTAMTRLERVLWRDHRLAGLAHAAIGIGGAAALGTSLERAASHVASRFFDGTNRSAIAPADRTGQLDRTGQTSRTSRFVVVTAATTITVAGRMLGEVAAEIGTALEQGDLDRARTLLPSLVGRRPDDLDEHEIARAVIESVAENTVDAVLSPALWAAGFGAAGTLGYRAVNTLDAMVGHHSQRYERFGWASAHLDDVANWLAARIGVVLIAAVRPSRAAAIVTTAWRDGPAHPSPNGGLVEAATAAALGITLGGTNRYGTRVEHRAQLGSGRQPIGQDITAAVRLLRDVSVLLAAILTISGLVGAVSSSSRPRRRRWLDGPCLRRAVTRGPS